MMCLKLMQSPADAVARIAGIPHATCRKGLQRHWLVAVDGTVLPRSKHWLFCWAMTGQGSERARQAAVKVWDAIMPIPFAKAVLETDHEWARAHRYQ
jgi:hypothetical protein